jgi:hypothetical protein
MYESFGGTNKYVHRMKKNVDLRNIKPMFHCTYHFLIATGYHYSFLELPPPLPTTKVYSYGEKV